MNVCVLTLLVDSTKGLPKQKTAKLFSVVDVFALAILCRIWYNVINNIVLVNWGGVVVNMISEYDLIQAMSGANEYGEGKCTIAIRQQRQNADGILRDVDDEFVSEKPIVQVSRQTAGFVCVDLIFNSVEDKDLKIIYSCLERFFASTNSMSDNGLDFPVLSFAIIPHAFNGKYWAMGLNPIFRTLTPEDSTGEPRIIRMTFVCQEDQDALPNFLFLQTPDSYLNALDISEDEEQFSV